MSAIPALIASNAAASAQASARQKVLAPFEEARAFGPGEAIEWRPEGDTAAQLIKAGVIKELRPGRYYVDKGAEQASHQAAGKILTLVLGLALLIGLVLLVTR